MQRNILTPCLILCAALTLNTASAAQIADSTWTLTTLTDASGTTPVGGMDAPTLILGGTTASTAGGTQVSGSAGCNVFSSSSVFGSELKGGGTLRLNAIAATQKLCSDAQMTLERRYLNVLSQARAFVRVGDTLILTSGTSKAVYKMGSEMSGEMASHLKAPWQLVGAQGTEPLILMFGEDGRVSGSTGCNNLMGEYSVAGGELTFGPLGVTRRACDPALGQQEQTFLKDLSEVTKYEITTSTLKLTTKSGKVLELALIVN